MEKFFALDAGGDIVGLGEFKGWEQAAETEAGLEAVYVLGEESARDWLVSLAVLLGASIQWKET